MKKLLTFGCSYTDQNYIKLTARHKEISKDLIDHNGIMTGPFPFWPQLLAKKLDMQNINYAQCGMGNNGIFSLFLDNFMNQKDIGLVIIMWSEFLRISFEKKSNTRFARTREWWKLNINANIKGKNNHLRKPQLEVSEVLDKYDLISLDSLTRNSIRFFLTAQQICDSKNIRFVQVMGMPPTRKSFEESACKTLIDSPLYDEINESFIGWPIFPQIDGFSCGSKLYELDPNREEYFINYDNVHPNAKGQEFITELLYKEVTKNGSI